MVIFVFFFWSLCDTCVPIPSLPTGTLWSPPLFPRVLCCRLAAIYNNRLISQRELPNSQQLLLYQSSSIVHAGTSTTMPAHMKGGELHKEQMCLFFFFLEPVAHRVIERWQIRFYPFRRSLLCNPLAQQQTRLVMVLFDTLFPLHGWLKNYHCFLETALVMLHCFLLMELYGEKINAEEPPVFRESTHTKIKTLCAFKQGVVWASITYWTSHPCSVEMEMGHCCWSHSWHRHSERTKWMHLQKK